MDDSDKNLKTQPAQACSVAVSTKETKEKNEGVAAATKIRGSEVCKSGSKSSTMPATYGRGVQNQSMGKTMKSVMELPNFTCSTLSEDLLLKNNYSVLACIT
ncbi:hypothetical protein ACJRO7_014069 [Eucalyptus globulus]|uniref:Uncharacterized protein n=1 Tax=Eucalyptus globulus TaxID=34317 RepID=A0ABD3L2T4_EUCGL